MQPLLGPRFRGDERTDSNPPAPNPLVAALRLCGRRRLRVSLATGTAAAPRAARSRRARDRIAPRNDRRSSAAPWRHCARQALRSISMAAQSPGACARADHDGGARAILGEGFDRQAHSDASRPSASCPMQPMASQRTPSCRLAILRRAAVAVGHQPFLDREAVAAARAGSPVVPSAPADGGRLPVAGDQHIGPRQPPAPTGLRRAPAPRRSSAAASATGTAAASPAVASSSGPVPKAWIWPTAPGRCATHNTTAIIQSTPCPISCQNSASKPNGMREHAENAHRHHPGRNHRHGEQIGEHAVGRQAMEVKGRVRRGGEPCDQRGQHHAGDLAPAPQRHARGQRRVGLGAPRQAVLIGRDQRQRRGKRHLEARMHDRLRREQQHGEGGDRDGAEGQRRPVEHDADQHDRDHDEGALRGDARARQHQIESTRSPSAPAAAHFLIGLAAGQRRDQRKAGADEEEHDARHHRHVDSRRSPARGRGSKRRRRR